MRALRIACLLACLSALPMGAQQSQPAAPAQPPVAAAAAPAAPSAPAASAAKPAPEEEPAGPLPVPEMPADLQKVVARQFGPNFKVAEQRVMTRRYLHEPERAPWLPFMLGDLDGDGVEDAVIVTRAKNPFSGQIPYHYSVIDPYYSAFGYGNPLITSGMADEYPDGNYIILVIHGAGPEGWRAARPKAKFAMINLPFNTVNVAPITVKKKELHAIILEEDGSNQSSLVVWDGKKYRWRDMGGPGE